MLYYDDHVTFKVSPDREKQIKNPTEFRSDALIN